MNKSDKLQMDGWKSWTAGKRTQSGATKFPTVSIDRASSWGTVHAEANVSTEWYLCARETTNESILTEGPARILAQSNDGPTGVQRRPALLPTLLTSQSNALLSRRNGGVQLLIRQRSSDSFAFALIVGSYLLTSSFSLTGASIGVVEIRRIKIHIEIIAPVAAVRFVLVIFVYSRRIYTRGC